MQLDIFEHSRDVVLRNAAIDALRLRDADACARALALAPRLELPELDSLVRGFDAEFEGEGAADDFAWFPAWVLIADRRRVAGLRLAREGAHTPPEICARIVLGLLALERQGRHGELVAGRAKLRSAHPALFARYMQDR